MAFCTTYVPAKQCTSGPTAGAKALMSWYLGAYASKGGRNLGIYLCRDIAGSNTLSLHGEGRACDLGVPTGAKWAQQLADWLIANHKALGIQLVIYNRKVWSLRYPDKGWRTYTGSNPHTDHLHVELCPAAAKALTVDTIKAVAAGKPSTPKPPPAPPAFPGRLLQHTPHRLIRGADVRTWQQRMRDRGWRITVDGVYGPQSADVCKRFQREKRLQVDGIVGPITWRASWTAPITRT